MTDQPVSAQPVSAAVCILEIVSLDLQCTPAQLRAQIEVFGLPVRVIGELNCYPGIIVETDDSTVSLLREYLGVEDSPVEIIEIRRHFYPLTLSTDRVVALVIDCCRGQRLAIGAGAVERAAQRRRLELIVLAGNVAKHYAKMVQAVVTSTGYQGPLVVTELTSKELGCAAGVHRAGCVGVLRGSRHVIL